MSICRQEEKEVLLQQPLFEVNCIKQDQIIK
ncbi:hypothetical protein GTHT12_03766 (plasmid) [Geobacillus thermodenitrificans]|nr:hypothetical protein GTHT12_03766 [Geobacillus thermodenitrificans]